MPKEIQEIKGFHAGTVSVLSETDIPTEAASYSENLDPISEEGKLKGLPDDTVLKTDGTFSQTFASAQTINMHREAKVINDSGTDRVVYFDSDGDVVRKIDTFNTTPTNLGTSVGSVSSSSNEVTMELNNKEVHIGTGNASTDIPKWCGVIPHGQFGASPTAGLQIEDAELKDPGSFPDIYKAVIDSDEEYIYGIEWEGTRVYKFRVATGYFVGVSDYVFTKTSGLALASDGGLWVIDDLSGTFHVIKIDPVDMIDLMDVTLAATGGVNSLSDIIEIGDYLWFSRHGVEGTDGDCLWNKATSNFVLGAATQTLERLTPWMGVAGGAPSQGDWHDGAGARYEVIFEVPKAALIDVGNDNYCGIMTVVERVSGAHPVNFQKDGSNSESVHSCIQMVYKTSSVHTKLSSGTDTGKLLRLNALTDYTSGTNLVHGFSNHGSGVITYGDNNGVTTISKFHNIGQSSGKLTYAGTTSGGTTASHGDFQTNSSLKNAYAFTVDNGTNVHVFDGYSSGRWAYGGVGSLGTNLESIIEPVFASVDGAFSATHGDAFFYKFSFVYDGYQESPLSTIFKTTEPDGADRAISITMNLRNLSKLPKRVTHLNLYRASSSTAADATPTGFYRLVKSFPLDKSWKEVVDSTSNPSWGNYRQRTFIDNGNVGTSYEALNGISETLDSTLPNYALSTQLNNIHFIAKCSHPDLDDANTFMFKSQPYNFDQFDWSLDLLRLPTVPTAIKAFQGRIYAFDENNTYKIEPNNFYIEDTFEGVGCSGPNSVVVTEYGMFFCNKNNIWRHDGQTPQAIGTPIIRNFDNDASYGWQDNNLGTETFAIFDSLRNSVYFTWRTATFVSYFFWSYNIFKNRWDLINLDSPIMHNATSGYGVKGYVIGRNGEIYISVYENIGGTGLQEYFYHFLGSSTYKRAWTFRTKKLTFGVDNQVKKIKKVRMTGTPTGALNNGTGIRYYADGSEVTATNSLTDARFSGVTGNNFQIILGGQTNEVDSIGIIYRRRPVK